MIMTTQSALECIAEERDRSDEKIIRSLGLRAKMEGGLVIVNRECFNSFGEDYEIAFDQETLRALDRIATREMERQILDQK
jgi:hypothetical protein